jgi:hypothetical protein
MLGGIMSAELRPPTVGRRWYVEICQGTLGSQAFFGTTHLSTGNQVWGRLDLGTDMSQLTEGQILDELWSACIQLMEARTHLT